MAEHNIVVVDDDVKIRTLLTSYLGEQGFDVTPIEGGRELIAFLKDEAVDLVILDLMMPGPNGIEVAKQVWNSYEVPIIFLTGQGDLVDVVVGLEIGADDYITKPFQLREVLARVRSVLRRSGKAVGKASSRARRGVAHYRFEGMLLDVGKRVLERHDGAVTSLTAAEFDLLCAFVSHPHEPLSRDRLMELTKGRSWSPVDRSLDTQVTRLRKKMDGGERESNLIKAVRGVGYVFTANVESVYPESADKAEARK